MKKQKKPRIKLKIPKRHFAFACDICNKKFNYYERLEAHKLEHDGKVVSSEKLKKTVSATTFRANCAYYGTDPREVWVTTN